MLSTPAGYDLKDAFDRVDLTGLRAAVVAVSGGSDSNALLIAFKRWCDLNRPDYKIIAVTIDHRLRPESAAEARTVAELCAVQAIPHRTIRWNGNKPASGLAAAARDARYTLLAEAARDADAGIVLTGHTADDQAETVLMRSARGDGPGLAGMARAMLFDRTVWIMRPLLDCRRDALRRFLNLEGFGWIEDPSNVDPAFERARARQMLAGTDRIEPLLEAARTGQAHRTALSRAAAGIISRHVAMAAPGLLRLDRSFPLGEAAGRYALASLLACAGGSAHLPSAEKVDRLVSVGGGSLAGAVFSARKSGFFIHREKRGANAPVYNGGVLDGRFSIPPGVSAAGWEPALAMSPTGDDEGVPDDLPLDLVRTAAAMEAQLIRVGPSAATVSAPKIIRRLAPFDHFLPEFELKLADAVAGVYGLDPYPPPPVAKPKFPES